MPHPRPHRPPGFQPPRRPPPARPRPCAALGRILDLLHKLVTGGAALATLVRLLLG